VALAALNPHSVPLSRQEEEQFDTLFATFMKRQGFSVGSETMIKRQFLHGWAVQGFLHDSARKLKLRRKAVEDGRASDIARELASVDADADVTRQRQQRLATLGLAAESENAMVDSYREASPAPSL
jgi:hypothetical protein